MKSGHPEAPRIYVVAGEVSGDRLAADLVRALKKRNPGMKVFGVGGSMLRAAGQEQSFDLVRHAVVGLTDVLKNLPKFLMYFRQVKAEILRLRPDVVILVDYPGFNLRMAKALHRENPPPAVVYYVRDRKSTRLNSSHSSVSRMPSSA